MPPRIKHTTCRHCGAAIVGVAPYRRDKWRDGRGLAQCPLSSDGLMYHAPVAERLTIRKDTDMRVLSDEDANNRRPGADERTPPPARLYFLVAVDVDRSAILADNPPEDVGECIAGELRAHLDEKGVRGACGVVVAQVEPIHEDDGRMIQEALMPITSAADVVRRLRRALWYYAFNNRTHDGAWNESAHADAYEDSKTLVPLAVDEEQTPGATS